MAEFMIVKLSPGPIRDKMMLLAEKHESYLISSNIEELTRFMHSASECTDIHSKKRSASESTDNRVSEKTGGFKRLAMGHDRTHHLQSIGTNPFSIQGTGLHLLNDAVVVGEPNLDFNSTLLEQEHRPLNAADLLVEEPEKYKNPLFSEKLVKEEIDEDGEQKYGTVEGLVKEESMAEDFGDSGHSEKGDIVENLVMENVNEDDGCQKTGTVEGLVKEDDTTKDFGDSGEHEIKGVAKKTEEMHRNVPDLPPVTTFSDCFNCNVCDMTFEYYLLLALHHGQEHPMCTVCEIRFSTPDALSAHEPVHTICEICGKYFPVKSALNRHRFLHTGERPFECKVCQKRFAMKSTLKQHMRIHTGEKPFECPECHSKFSQSGNLSNHRRRHFH